MHKGYSRRTLTKRSSRRKRLPESQIPPRVGGVIPHVHHVDLEPDESESLGPITITVIQTRSASSTSVTSTSSSLPLTSLSSQPPVMSSTASSTATSTATLDLQSSSSLTVTTAQTSSQSSITVPSPSVSLQGEKSPQQSDTDAVAPQLPTGAIVGIVIACLIVLVAAVVFGTRKMSITRRLRLRGKWTKSKGMTTAYPAQLPITWQPEPYPIDVNSVSDMTFVQGSSVNQYTPPRPPNVLPRVPVPPASYGNSGMSSPVSPSSPLSNLQYAPGTTSSSPFIVPIKCTFIPALPDELSIETGEFVRVLAEYDDGWAYCANMQGEKGMVPIECLDRGVTSSSVQENSQPRRSRRAASLHSSVYTPGGY